MFKYFRIRAIRRKVGFRSIVLYTVQVCIEQMLTNCTVHIRNFIQNFTSYLYVQYSICIENVTEKHTVFDNNIRYNPECSM